MRAESLVGYEQPASQNATGKRNSFFSSFEEAINLVPPIVFLFFMIPDLIESYKYSQHEQILINLYANIFWLNAIHGSFFLALPFADSNAKAWFFGSNNQHKLKFIGTFASIFVLTFLIFSFTVGVFPNKTGIGKIISNIGLFLLIAVPSFHYIRQSYGLSRLYDKKQTPRKASLDFYGFHTILIFVILATVILKLDYPRELAGISTVKLLATTSFLIILTMVLSSFYLDKSKMGVKKAMFQIRLFLHPLSFFYPLSGIFMRGTHGLEYYFVMKSLFKDRQVTKLFVGVFIAVSTLITVLILAHQYGIPKLIYLEGNQLPIWVLLASSFLYSISQVHYWSDYFLFSLKVTNERKDTPLSRLRESVKPNHFDSK